MSSRAVLISLFIILLIISGGNFVVATLTLSHAPTGLQDPWYVYGWVIFFVLQLAAPITLIKGREGAPLPRALERLQWAAYLAAGVMSTMLVLATILELLFVVARGIAGDQPWLDGVWFWTMVIVSLWMVIVGILQASIGPRIATVEIKSERLPPEFDGYRIVQISDLHVSSLLGRRYTRDVVQRANQLSADLVALTGDFVDGSVSALGYRFAPLGDLQSRDGRFFVTGNHEYYHGADSWIAEHRRIGEIVLMNEHRVIQRGNASLVIAGVTDVSAGRFIASHAQDIPKALNNASSAAFKILLAHQPGCYEEAATNGVDLQLSGHTHGGQFFPWQFVVHLVHRYAKGLYKHKSMWIYVNPGTGFWGPPLRATVPPEITLIVLRSQSVK